MLTATPRLRRLARPRTCVVALVAVTVLSIAVLGVAVHTLSSPGQHFRASQLMERGASFRRQVGAHVDDLVDALRDVSQHVQHLRKASEARIVQHLQVRAGDCCHHDLRTSTLVVVLQHLTRVACTEGLPTVRVRLGHPGKKGASTTKTPPLTLCDVQAIRLLHNMTREYAPADLSAPAQLWGIMQLALEEEVRARVSESVCGVCVCTHV